MRADRTKLRLAHKILLIAILPLLFTVSFVLIFRTVLNRAEAVSQRERRANATTSACYAAIAPFALEGSLILASRTANNRFSNASIQKSRASSRRSLAEARELCQDNPDELQIVDEVSSACDQLWKTSDNVISMLHTPTIAPFMAEFDRKGLKTINRINELQEKLNTRVQEDLKKDQTDSKALRRLIQILILTGLVCVVALSLAMAVLLSRQISGRLDVIAQNSKRYSNGEVMLPPLGGSDEIADLDRIFHHTVDALLEATGKEKAAIAHALDVICSLDRANRFIAVSPSSLATWGFEPAELLGLNCLRLLAPEDMAPTQLALSNINKGSDGTFENRIIHKDGALKDMVWSVRWSAQEESLFAIAHDISERKLAERTLRANETQIRLMMERMPAGLLVLSAKGIISLINTRTEQMFGYSGAELIGQPVSVLFRDERTEPAAFMHTLTQKAMGKVVPMEAMKRGGEKRFLELSLDTFGGSEGQPEYLLILLDMTETYEVQRLKQRLIAMIAHDIAAPLSSIGATLKLLAAGAMGPLPSKDQSRIAMAEQESQRLIRLFKELLRIEKYDAHEIALTMATVSLSAIVERSIGLVQAQSEQKGVTLIDCCNTEIALTADADRLTQVLVNLLSNAIKFSPSDSKITVSIKASADYVELSVCDQGRGIPAGMEAAIFEPLKQITEADATEKGGFGLGLAICKAIVQGHGGSIGVINNDGGGATFWVKLPLVPMQITKTQTETTLEQLN